MRKYIILKVVIFKLIPVILLAYGENWIYRYDGPGHGSDAANSIIYGLDGNIYVAGYSYDGITYDDFTVISIADTGYTNWAYRYNYQGHGSDAANSIIYGLDGNIYAVGYSEDSITGYDFTVISIADTGYTNWVYRYNGSANGFDIANSIVYGADGNIYAAGYSEDSITGYDFIVISLTTTGDTNWTYRYNGPGNGSDVANSIAYGADGNIYAAGYIEDSTTYEVFTVVSLTAAGNTNWIYYYHPDQSTDYTANSIVFGADSSIYVAGARGSDMGFIVISLNAFGDSNWVYRGNNGCANGIVYGTDGNMYAAGSYNLNFTIKSLGIGGYTNWTYYYNPGYYDYATSIAYGIDGNIYAAGFADIGSTGPDIAAISLTSSGDTNWTYLYCAPFDDGANSIVYGADSNVYVAGFSANSSAQGDIIVISLPSEPNNTIEDQKIIDLNSHICSSIFFGPLRLPKGKKCKVFDITGRIVMPGQLKPGVYFIQIDNKIVQKVIKVR